MEGGDPGAEMRGAGKDAERNAEHRRGPGILTASLSTCCVQPGVWGAWGREGKKALSACNTDKPAGSNCHNQEATEAGGWTRKHLEGHKPTAAPTTPKTRKPSEPSGRALVPTVQKTRWGPRRASPGWTEPAGWGAKDAFGGRSCQTESAGGPQRSSATPCPRGVGCFPAGAPGRLGRELTARGASRSVRGEPRGQGSASGAHPPPQLGENRLASCVHGSPRGRTKQPTVSQSCGPG